MAPEWFPFPSGILLSSIVKKESSDDESSDDESSDVVISQESPYESTDVVILQKSPHESSDDESSDLVILQAPHESSADESSEYSSDDEYPEYPSDEIESSVGKLKGTHLDVVPFLSNNGKTTHLLRCNGETVGIDEVRGKYVLICCVNLPVYFQSIEYETCRSLIDAYSNLRGNFEIVLVANMGTRFHLRQDVFDKFCSAFQCLAVPFSESDTRKFICSSIGLRHRLGGHGIEAILVDPTGLILQHRMASNYFNTFGSEWYPFTDKHVEFLEIQDDILRMRLDPFYRKRETVSPQAEAIVDSYQQQPPTLSLHADILLCDWSLVLHRVDPTAGPSMTVSQLCEKHVGLYLCYDGKFIDTLNEVHKECVALNRELEIVIVGLPLSDDPISYHQNLVKLLKLYNITSWFLFPLEENRKVYRRLWRVFANDCDYDKLVILPPYKSGQPGEIEASALINQFGTNTYPFTATKTIEQRYNALKSINPLSWFKDSRKKKRTCLIRNDSESYVRKSTLLGKKLLLYVDSLRLPDNGDYFYEILEHYDEIKASGCEVVFVPLDEQDIYLHDQHAAIDEMPWPIMPVQAAIDASVIPQLLLPKYDIFDRDCSILIAVGEDGKIVSKEAYSKLMEQGVTESLFADTLYQEVVQELTYLDPHADYDSD